MEGTRTDTTTVRRNIMEMARFLFRRQGFDRTTMRDITDRLSLSEAEISRYFITKDDLLEAVWSE